MSCSINYLAKETEESKSIKQRNSNSGVVQRVC